MDIKQLLKNTKNAKKDLDLKNKGSKKIHKHFIGGEIVTDLHLPNREIKPQNKENNKIDAESVEEISNINDTKPKKEENDFLDNTQDEKEQKFMENPESQGNQDIDNFVTGKYTPLPHKNDQRGKRKSGKQIYKEFERLIKNNHSKNTVKSYKQSIKFWNKVADRLHKPIYRLEAQEIEEAISKYAPRTKNSKLVALKLLGKIYLRNNLFELPIEIQRVLVKSKPAKEVAQYLSEDDYNALKLEIRQGIKEQKREYLWLGLFLFCGLRISEVETITIQDSQSIKVLGKGNKERIVPCLPNIVVALKTMKDKGYGGWRVNGKILDKHLRRNNYLDKFHCHQLRHTYATYLYRKGVDLNTLKELLGHETILTTQIYAKSKVDKSILQYL